MDVEEADLSSGNIAVPDISDSKVEIELPVGSFGYDNQFYKTIRHGRLSGTVRKNLGKPAILNHPGRLITTALAEMAEYPHMEKMAPSEKRLQARAMFSADRAAVVLSIRKATKGDKPIIQRTECPWCGGEIQIETSPDEIGNVKLEDTEYKKSEEDFFLEVNSHGHLIRLRLSRGFTEEALTMEQIRNINESSNLILGYCTKDFDGQPIEPDFYEFQDVDLVDEITEAFIANQPGPKVQLRAKCSECNRGFDYAVDPSDFLLPSVGRRRSSKRGGK